MDHPKDHKDYQGQWGVWWVSGGIPHEFDGVHLSAQDLNPRRYLQAAVIDLRQVRCSNSILVTNAATTAFVLAMNWAARSLQPLSSRSWTALVFSAARHQKFQCWDTPSKGATSCLKHQSRKNQICSYKIYYIKYHLLFNHSLSTPLCHSDTLRIASSFTEFCVTHRDTVWNKIHVFFCVHFGSTPAQDASHHQDDITCLGSGIPT